MPTFLPNEPQNSETVDADLLRNQFNSLNDSITVITAGPAGPQGLPGANGAPGIDADPIVGAVNGIVKADGAGTISAAVPGSDYLTPTGDGSGLTGVLTTLAGHNVSELANDAGYYVGDGSAFAPAWMFSRSYFGSNGGGNTLVFANQSLASDTMIQPGPGAAGTGGAGGVYIQDNTNYWIYIAGGAVSDSTGKTFLRTGDIPTEISAFANNAGYLTADNTADGTYTVANDGAASGQLASITIANGLITGVTVLP